MVDRKDGISILITEADLEDYPGLYLYGTNGNTLKVKFPHYVLTEKLIRDRNVRPLEVGDYIAVARQKGSGWFIGALNDWTPRELEVKLDFLPAGTYTLIEFVDGINADQYAEDYARKESTVTSGESIKIKMAPGGGYAAMLKAVKE